MTWLAAALFWFGFVSLPVIWFGYPLVLWLLVRLRRSRPVNTGDKARTATVLVAAHNEEANIASRLDNILANGSRDVVVSVLVALDHCTDSTERIVEAWAKDNHALEVNWFRTSGRGKANAHNEAVPQIATDLLVFTDADTLFLDGFVDRIVHVFDDPRVGYCSGVLAWRGKTTEGGASHFPLYWRFESWLRLLESRLDICAVGTGACAAIRPRLFLPLNPTSDSDCSTPLDVIRQGYLCRIQPEARAVDYVADTVAGEFRARVRMTAKNFMNTIGSWRWREGIVKRPGVTAALLLHKIGRWLTPFLLLALLAGGTLSLALGHGGGFIGAVTFAAYGGLIAAAVGFLWPDIPILGALGSFAMANVAFAAGVIRSLSGKAPTSFGKTP